MPAALAFGASSRAVGGAGVAMQCGGPDGRTESVIPVVFDSAGKTTRVPQSVVDGDVVRMAYEAGPMPGTAVSSLQNLTQGWTWTSAPFPAAPAVFSQVGDSRYYAQNRDGLVIYYDLPPRPVS